MKQKDQCRAAVYIRVGSGFEADHEPAKALQLVACQAATDEQKITVGQVFCDLGVSGRQADRPGWSQLMQEASTGQVSHVAIHRRSTLARSPLLYMAMEGQLQQHGVALIVASELKAAVQ